MSKINKNRKLGSKILLSSLSVPALVSSVQQTNANAAGWFSNIISGASKAYNSVKKSAGEGFSQAEKSVSEAYNQVKNTVKSFLVIHEHLNKKRERSLSELGELVADTIKAKKSVSEAYNQVKDSVKYFLYTDQDRINEDKKTKKLSALGEFIADNIEGSYEMYTYFKNVITGNKDENFGLTNKESWASFIENLADLNLSNVSFFKNGLETIYYKNDATSVKIKSKDGNSVIEIKYNEENKIPKYTLTNYKKAEQSSDEKIKDEKTEKISDEKTKDKKTKSISDKDEETELIKDTKTLMKEIKKILKQTNPQIKVYTEAYNNNPKSLKDIKFSKYDKATEEEWKSFVNKLEKGEKVSTASLHDANGYFSSIDKNTVWFKLKNGKNSGIGLTYLSNGKIMIARADVEKYQEGKGIPLTWSVSEDFNDLKSRLSYAFPGNQMSIKLQENTSAPVTSLDDIFSNTTQSSTNKI